MTLCFCDFFCSAYAFCSRPQITVLCFASCFGYLAGAVCFWKQGRERAHCTLDIVHGVFWWWKQAKLAPPKVVVEMCVFVVPLCVGACQ